MNVLETYINKKEVVEMVEKAERSDKTEETLKKDPLHQGVIKLLRGEYNKLLDTVFFISNADVATFVIGCIFAFYHHLPEKYIDEVAQATFEGVKRLANENGGYRISQDVFNLCAQVIIELDKKRKVYPELRKKSLTQEETTAMRRLRDAIRELSKSKGLNQNHLTHPTNIRSLWDFFISKNALRTTRINLSKSYPLPFYHSVRGLLIDAFFSS